MESTTDKSPKQKLVVRLGFSFVLLVFSGTVMRKHEVHGVMTDPNIPAGIIGIAIAVIAAVIVILVYRNEIKNKS
jgi:TRAP-type C4-dicarboxylate transport system permease small subunit